MVFCIALGPFEMPTICKQNIVITKQIIFNCQSQQLIRFGKIHLVISKEASLKNSSVPNLRFSSGLNLTIKFRLIWWFCCRFDSMRKNSFFFNLILVTLSCALVWLLENYSSSYSCHTLITTASIHLMYACIMHGCIFGNKKYTKQKKEK